MGKAPPGQKRAEKPSKRAPIEARPKPDLDRKALRAEINKRFSKTLDYLSK